MSETEGAPAATRRNPTDLPFIKNTWYVAGWSSEFDTHAPMARTIIDEPVVFYRQRDRRLIALEDRCPHRWAPLSRGRIEGDDLRCMYHGLKLSYEGRCIEVPGQERIPQGLGVRSFPTLERHRFAWVWLGEAERADPGLIPDLSMLDEPSRRLYWGSLDYEAHASLINDNLLDLSHIAYLHEKTAGQPVVHLAEGDLTPCIPGGAEAQALERGVRVETWVTGALARNILVPRNVPNGDLWTRTDFLVPGIFISQDRMYPAGTASACRAQPPNDALTAAAQSPLSDAMSIQAVTPMSARKTRYFFSYGPRTSDMEEWEANSMWEIVRQTFFEDVAMINAQQRMIDHHPGTRMTGIAADRGLVLFRKLMKALADGEGPPPLARSSLAITSP